MAKKSRSDKHRYAREPESAATSAKAKGSYLRVHFKNTRESAQAIKGMTLSQAKKYLNDVLEHKQVCTMFGERKQSSKHT